MAADTEEKIIEKTNNMEQHTEKQKETLANTMQKRKWISLSVWLEELWRAMWVATKKPQDKQKNQNQISEELEQHEKRLIRKRPPIIIN